jgi:hypothetical protein
MKLSTTVQEKGDLSMQVTACEGSTVVSLMIKYLYKTKTYSSFMYLSGASWNQNKEFSKINMFIVLSNLI